MLTANLSVNWNFSIEDNVKRVIARPFCGSHEKMLNYFGKGFELNVPAALEWLDKETNSREKESFLDGSLVEHGVGRTGHWRRIFRAVL